MADADPPVTKKIPRYMQVAAELRQAILAGQFAKGKPFPTETALCREYDVSRFTVREALKRHGVPIAGVRASLQGFGNVSQYAAKLFIPDRCEIEWFVGPHTINGKKTYDFLHRHLKWPKP